MRAIILLTLLASTLLVVFVVFIAADLHSVRVDANPVYEPIPARLLPGNRLPAHAWCTWQYYDKDTVPCYVFVEEEGAEVWFAYDPARGRIVTAARTARDKMTGDLIRAWGTPTGLTRQGSDLYVYWPTRYAYLSGRNFSPQSQVVFVSYNADAIPSADWSGFTNR